MSGTVIGSVSGNVSVTSLLIPYLPFNSLVALSRSSPWTGKEDLAGQVWYADDISLDEPIHSLLLKALEPNDGDGVS